METGVKELIKEYVDVYHNINYLRDFITRSHVLFQNDSDEILVRKQERVLTEYAGILRERIERGIAATLDDTMDQVKGHWVRVEHETRSGWYPLSIIEAEKGDFYNYHPLPVTIAEQKVYSNIVRLNV